MTQQGQTQDQPEVDFGNVEQYRESRVSSLRFQGSESKEQIPNSKHQIPMIKNSNSKGQDFEFFPISCLKFGAFPFWNLVFIWNLVLGTWCFPLSCQMFD